MSNIIYPLKSGVIQSETFGVGSNSDQSSYPLTNSKQNADISKVNFLEARAIGDGGSFEAKKCAFKALDGVNTKEDKLILLPNAYGTGVIYALKPTDGTGDATVVRNTTKTRVNASRLIEEMPANVLAPDFISGSCPVLNIEGQSTNLLTYSEDFTQSVWTKVNVTVTADATTSPDGNITADKIIADNTNNTHNIRQDFDRVGKNFASVFAKKAEYDTLIIRRNSTNVDVVLCTFDLTNGTSSGTGSSIVDYGNGWFRCIVEFNQLSAGASAYQFRLKQDAAFLGDGTSGLFLWGANVSENLSSYIPTTTAQATRNADDVSVTVPSGVTEIIEKLEDGTTNTITTIPATYTPSTNRYEYILMR